MTNKRLRAGEDNVNDYSWTTHILTTSACFIRTVPDGMQATDRIPSKSEESYDEQI